MTPQMPQILLATETTDDTEFWATETTETTERFFWILMTAAAGKTPGRQR